MKTILFFCLVFFVSTLKAEDLSHLAFSVNTVSTTSYVYPMLIDQLGRKTGFDFDSKKWLKDIPNSGYTSDSADDYETGEKGQEVVSVGLSPVAAGTYTVKLTGVRNSVYMVSVGAGNVDGGDIPISGYKTKGYIAEGDVLSLVIPVNPALGATAPILNTILTYDSLRKDVLVAKKLIQLGDDKFENSLLKNIDLAERLAGMSDKHKVAKITVCAPAAAVLRLFVNRLELANRKCETSGGCDEGPELAAFEKAHRGDRDYADFFRAWDKDDWHKWKKTSKRFVTDEALAIVRGDAEALIKTLEPSPKEQGKH